VNILEIINNTTYDFLNENNMLSEGGSDILYHFTNTYNLINILNNNEFNLSIAIGTPSDFNTNKKRFFFFSTTRSKNSGFVRGDVKIVLDSYKLKQRYKITPVDYWQYSTNPSDYSNKDDYINALKHSEQEDRIVSNKSTIPNAINYILELHILLDNYNLNNLHKINDYCKQNNVNANYYNNKKNWLNQTNQIELPDLSDTNNDDDGNHRQDRFDFRLASLISFNNEDGYNKIVNYLNNPEDINEFKEQLNKDTYNYFKLGAQYNYETLNVFQNVIHNIRSNTDVNSKFLINLLATDMKKNKTGTLVDYIAKKQWVGKKTKSEYLNELYNYINNIIDNQFIDDIQNQLYNWIEIDGNYYNNAYDSEELMGIIMRYVGMLKETYKKIVYSNDYDILKHSFYLNEEYINNMFNYKFINVTQSLNITDKHGYYDDDYLNEVIQKLFYYLIHDISRKGYLKAVDLQNEFNQQFQ
jgi:hypothetical protein